jgi:two-component system response regulator CpxR
MAIITISRTLFSGGEQIAHDVATKLGYPCLRRKELIHGAAEDFNFEETKLVEAMAEPPKLWQRDRDKREAHFNLIRAAFLKRCNEQDLVYHGFSGQELIRKVPHVLRILVVADESYRVETAMKQSGIDRDEALTQIKASDKKFNKWTRHMYGFEWKDPSLYDLVFNLGRVSQGSAVETILGIIARGDFDSTDASRQIFADELLASLVWSALARNEETNASYLETFAKQGRVTITGTARSERILNAITDVAEKVEGVVEVENEMSIGTIWRS